MKHRYRIPGSVRRIIPRAIIFFLLGAIVNVAVAWGCAISFRNLTGEGEWIPYHNPQGEPLVVFVAARHGFERVHGCARSGTLLSRYSDRVRTYERSCWWRPENVRVVVPSCGIAAGWPALALAGSRSGYWTPEGDEGDDPTFVSVVTWGLSIANAAKHNSGEPQLLPFRTLWPGFAINTIFYAAMLWLLFAAPLALRRRRRIKRGLCPACAYPIGASDVCTECGKPVTPRRGDGV